MISFPDIGTAGILFIVAVVMAFFLAVSALFVPKGRGGAAVSVTAENIIGMVAFTLAFASVLISINFPLSLADSVFIKFVLLLMFIGYVFIQYSVSFWLTAFWSNGAIPMIFAGLYLMLSTVLISIMAGQSFLADMTAARELELRQASDTYKAALSERQNASSAAAKLAVSDDAAASAQTALDRLTRERDDFMNSQAQNARGTNVGTVSAVIAKYGCDGYYSTYCAKSTDYTRQMMEHKQTLREYNAYQGAKSHAEQLAATALPTAQDDAKIPGFRALSEFIGVPYEKVRDNFWIAVSFFTETAAQLCFIFLGWNRRRRLGNIEQMTDNELQRLADDIERDDAPQEREPGIVDRFAEGFGRGAAEVAAAGSPARFVPAQSSQNTDYWKSLFTRGFTVPENEQQAAAIHDQAENHRYIVETKADTGIPHEAHKYAADFLHGLLREYKGRTQTSTQTQTVYKTVGNVKDCAHCGEPFTLTRSNKKYCCDNCRIAAWEKRNGKTFKRKSKANA